MYGCPDHAGGIAIAQSCSTLRGVPRGSPPLLICQSPEGICIFPLQSLRAGDEDERGIGCQAVAVAGDAVIAAGSEVPRCRQAGVLCQNPVAAHHYSRPQGYHISLVASPGSEQFHGHANSNVNWGVGSCLRNHSSALGTPRLFAPHVNTATDLWCTVPACPPTGAIRAEEEKGRRARAPRGAPMCIRPAARGAPPAPRRHVRSKPRTHRRRPGPCTPGRLPPLRQGSSLSVKQRLVCCLARLPRAQL